jgi:hypothetical protein
MPRPLTVREQLLLDLEAAEARLAWAKAQADGGSTSPALTKYLAETREELGALKSRQKKARQPPLKKRNNTSKRFNSSRRGF